MKSKEQILKECCEGAGVLFSNGDVYDGDTGPLERAMDEYAKEFCIEYAKWIGISMPEQSVANFELP